MINTNKDYVALSSFSVRQDVYNYIVNYLRNTTNVVYTELRNKIYDEFGFFYKEKDFRELAKSIAQREEIPIISTKRSSPKAKEAEKIKKSLDDFGITSKEITQLFVLGYPFSRMSKALYDYFQIPDTYNIIVEKYREFCNKYGISRPFSRKVPEELHRLFPETLEKARMKLQYGIQKHSMFYSRLLFERPGTFSEKEFKRRKQTNEDFER